LGAFFALGDVELDFLAFVEFAVSAAGDGGVVDEDVGSPPSCSMKPNPFSELNHLTVPVAMCVSFVGRCCGPCFAGRRSG